MLLARCIDNIQLNIKGKYYFDMFQGKTCILILSRHSDLSKLRYLCEYLAVQWRQLAFFIWICNHTDFWVISNWNTKLNTKIFFYVSCKWPYGPQLLHSLAWRNAAAGPLNFLQTSFLCVTNRTVYLIMPANSKCLTKRYNMIKEDNPWNCYIHQVHLYLK